MTEHLKEEFKKFKKISTDLIGEIKNAEVENAKLRRLRANDAESLNKARQDAATLRQMREELFNAKKENNRKDETIGALKHEISNLNETMNSMANEKAASIERMETALQAKMSVMSQNLQLEKKDIQKEHCALVAKLGAEIADKENQLRSIRESSEQKILQLQQELAIKKKKCDELLVANDVDRQKDSLVRSMLEKKIQLLQAENRELRESQNAKKVAHVQPYSSSIGCPSPKRQKRVSFDDKPSTAFMETPDKRSKSGIPSLDSLFNKPTPNPILKRPSFGLSDSGFAGDSPRLWSLPYGANHVSSTPRFKKM